MHPYAWPTESDALTLVPAFALGYYLVVRHRRVERWRIACFAVSLLLLVAVFATPVDTLAVHFLLTAHFLQNVTVAEWAPALFVLGLPPSLARRVHVPMLPALAAWLGRAAADMPAQLRLYSTRPAIDRGLHKLSLGVFTHNAAGIALYRKFGFVEEGRRVKQYRRASGELWDAVDMGLLL